MTRQLNSFMTFFQGISWIFLIVRLGLYGPAYVFLAVQTTSISCDLISLEKSKIAKNHLIVRSKTTKAVGVPAGPGKPFSPSKQKKGLSACIFKYL